MIQSRQIQKDRSRFVDNLLSIKDLDISGYTLAMGLVIYIDTIVTFNLVFLNEVTNTNHYIAINAWVHPKLPFDVVIGRPTNNCS